MSAEAERPGTGASITRRAEDSKQQKAKTSRTSRVLAGRLRAKGCMMDEKAGCIIRRLLKPVPRCHQGRKRAAEASSKLAA